MTGTIDAVLYAVLFFLGSHLALASPPLRALLVAKLGEGPFRALYPVVAAGGLVWSILAWQAAPYVELWPAMAWARMLPNLVMPFAAVLLVAGLSTPNPTAVGAEAAADDPRGPRGILTVTRHPMMWAFGLWALAHIPANGDQASLVLFAGIAVLAFAGMAALDVKKREQFGSKWGPIALTTSAIPFVAALQGRTKVDWRGIGWKRLGGGLLLWAVLHGAHPFLIGVSAVP